MKHILLFIVFLVGCNVVDLPTPEHSVGDIVYRVVDGEKCIIVNVEVYSDGTIFYLVKHRGFGPFMKKEFLKPQEITKQKPE